MNSLSSKDKIEKKFVLALLYDISISPITMKILKEIPWNDGIGKIVYLGFIDEPECVSFILSNFNRDVVIRNQILTIMQKDHIQEVLVT